MRGISEQERREANWKIYFFKGFHYHIESGQYSDSDIDILGISEVGYRFDKDSTECVLHHFGGRHLYRWND